MADSSHVRGKDGPSTLELVVAHVPGPSRKALQRLHLATIQKTVSPASMTDPASQAEGTLRVLTGHAGVPMARDVRHEVPESFGEALSPRLPAPARDPFERSRQGLRKLPRTALVASTTHPRAQTEAALDVTRRDGGMTFAGDEAFQTANAPGEAGGERVPGPTREATPVLQDPHLLRAQETLPIAPPVVGRPVAQGEVADVPGVENGGVTGLADERVQELEKLLELDGEAAPSLRALRSRRAARGAPGTEDGQPGVRATPDGRHGRARSTVGAALDVGTPPLAAGLARRPGALWTRRRRVPPSPGSTT